jgi:hypothetical protein
MVARSAAPTIQAFGLGQARAGTTSLVEVLGRSHRAEHEPEIEAAMTAAALLARGDVSTRDVAAWLCERDQRLSLHFDISFANQFLIEPLMAAFPAVRFLVQVRDPYTWIESVVGHLLHDPLPPAVMRELAMLLQPERHAMSSHDRELARRGLYPLATLATAWSHHLDVCLAIPAERRLVLRTHELERSTDRLAAFLHIPIASLAGPPKHLNQGRAPFDIDTVVDRRHLEDTIATQCDRHRKVLFPGIDSLDRAREMMASR